MTRNSQLYDRLERLSPESLGVFCLASAERGRTIYEILASEDEAAYYNELLDLAWASASGEAEEEQIVESLEAAEEELLTETDEDDEENSTFYAKQAGLLVVNALATQLNPSTRSAMMSANTLQTLLSNLDFILSGEYAQIRRADQPEPPLGPIQRTEQDAQDATLARLLAPEPIDLTTLRDESTAFTIQITGAVTAAAERKGWLDEG